MIGRALAVLLLLALPGCSQQADAAERPVLAPAAVRQADEGAGLKTAIFAGGCFWGVEGVFSHVRGVTSAVSGYHGGNRADAQYERVGQGGTGHAESVRITYDPARVRYDQLLQVYFSVVADPTQRDRQGPDVGTQYRGVIVPVSPEQRLVANAYLAQLRASGLWKAPIVTRMEPLRRFYPAEGYHQDYMLAHPQSGYIRAWDAPKVRALAALFPRLYQAEFTPG